MVGIVIFLPYPHFRVFAVRRVGKLFARASFLECGAHIERRALDRQHQCEKALTAPPADAAEISQRRPFHEHNCVERVLAHQLAGALLALVAFLACDRSRFALPRDRKSTRLNSSHGYISYAVFCLKKKKKNHTNSQHTNTQTSNV